MNVDKNKRDVLKMKNASSVMYSLSMLGVMGMGIFAISREYGQNGIASAIVLTVIMALATVLLYLPTRAKRILWKIVCNVVVVVMFTPLFLNPSENDDALFLRILLALFTLLAIIFGHVKSKQQTNN